MAAVNLSFSFRTPSIVNHNSRSVEHKTLLTAFGNLSTGIPWSVLWLLRTKIREPFGLSQIFCLLVKRTGLAYQRIILHIGNWWTIGKKLPQDAIKVTMNHNSRSVEHKTLLTAFGNLSTGIPWSFILNRSSQDLVWQGLDSLSFKCPPVRTFRLQTL